MMLGRTIAIFLTTLCFATANAAGPNLLSNSNFTAGQPIGWERDAWRFSSELFYWVHTARATTVGITIPAHAINDARWIQRVEVEPNTDYLLSAQIRTNDVTPAGQPVEAGANVSILEELPGRGFFTYSEPLFGDNNWTRVTLEFNSGLHSEVTVALRLGMFSGATSGTAWFRYVRLRKL